MYDMNSQQLQSALTKKWIAAHPYSQIDTHDKYYVGVAKEAYKVLSHSHLRNLSTPPSDDDMVHMAVVLAAYLEDFICEIGIWKAFIERHMEVADRYLPFFELPDYDPDYINPEDIHLMVWAWANALQVEIFLDPVMFLRTEVVKGLWEVLEAAIDKAPATSFFDEYLQIPDDPYFFDVRKRIEWLGIDSYLFGQLDLAAELEEKIQSDYRRRPDINDDDRHLIQYDLRLDVAINKITRFGGLRIPAMAARILRGSEKVLQKIAQISQKTSGRFLVQSITEAHYLLRHLPSNRELIVALQSGNKAVKLGEVITTSLVKWGDEFWISGLIIGTQNDQVDIKREGATVPLVFCTAAEYQFALDSLALQEQAFLEINGSLLVFCEDRREAVEVFHRWQIAVDKLTNSAKGRPATQKIPKMDLQMLEADDNVGIFMASGSGINFVPLAMDLVAFLQGLIGDDRDDAREAMIDLFQYCSLAYVEYIAANYPFARFNLAKQGFDVYRDRVALSWFLNPQESGPAVPEISITA